MNTTENTVERFIQLTKEAQTQQLYLIVDLCEFEYPLLEYINSWANQFEHALLFDETPENLIKEEGPLLLLLDIEQKAHLELLEKICAITDKNNRLIAFNSRFSFDILLNHLRTALQVSWGKKEGVLRYYAPDLFEAVNRVFSPKQYNWFHQYIRQWFFIADNGLWVVYHPDYHEQDFTEFNTNGFEFSESQYDALLQWAEVLSFRRGQGIVFAESEYGGEKQLLNQLYILSAKADEKKIFDQKERGKFYFDHIQKIGEEK